ncbi:ABC transporter permease [Algoriphagus terrigena]|uniref:ABC transporter permease n=1 Tax=Algoriphagus terrigena TaxID=344884 RepID=UPI000417EE14|nr:ABC transporter permease [Algoriphagus terrigena]
MIKTYFKIAWRSLKKNRLVSFINILGLSLGIATCLVISLYVAEELSYDRFFANSDRIYRVTLDAKIGDQTLSEASVMAPVAETFKEEIPEVEIGTRVLNLHSNTKVRIGEKVTRKGNTALVDSNFFEVFDLPFISGNPATALINPNSIVLTEDQANALFGKENPINQVIALEGLGYYSSQYFDLSGDYTVTGVIENIPENSHFDFGMLASMLGNPDAKNQSWLSGNYVTYLLLNNGATAEQVESKIPALTRKYMEDQMKQGLGMGFEEFFEKGNHVFLKLQALTDIHLNNQFAGKGDFEAGGDMQTVLIYCAIAAFMLLIACINFMNLSTAGASQRAKEIAVRKVMGSGKQDLVFQFLSESLIAVSIAMVLGIVAAKLALPFFNDFADKSLSLGFLFQPLVVLALLALILLVTLMAGGYPAFFLSAFQPIESLKKKITRSNRSGFRSSLVVFQFAVSVVLIIGTLVVSQQMNYIQNKDLGYDKEQLIVLRDAGLLGEHLDVFRDRLKSDPRVQSVTKSAYIPSGPTDTNSQNLVLDESTSGSLRMIQYGIDEEYIPTLGMEIVDGRNFSLDLGSEENNIIINQTAARELGIAEDPIGKVFEKRTDNQGGREEVKVVGVVKDFVAKSLREPIKPLMMVYNPYYSLILKVEKSELQPLLADMEKTWNGFNTGEAFQYAFLDELYNETYIQEAKMGSFLTVLSLMTIFVACLGLFGLVTFTAEQRIKEIGIRKVLGSTVNQIVGMLARDFIKLIGISLIIAFPAGYFFMDMWLENFAYHIDIAWWIYGMVAVITLVIAFGTICLRSIKAALMNPVDSLKNE